MKEIAIGIDIPVKVEDVVWPTIIYNESEKTGIYFETRDERFGRVTFEQLDSLKVSRGEYLPYKDNFDWENPDCPYCWISRVENSKWLMERYQYESKHYGEDYNWGGNVEEMLTDFSHFIFKFHDQFIEVIAKGFWIETDNKSLINKKLLTGHPFLPISDEIVQNVEIENKKYIARINSLNIKELIEQSFFCSQKLITFTEEKGKRPDYYSTIFKSKCSILDYFDRNIGTFDEVLTVEQMKSLIEKKRNK